MVLINQLLMAEASDISKVDWERLLMEADVRRNKLFDQKSSKGK